MSKIQDFTKIQGLNEKDDISTQDYLVATSLQHVIAGMINIQLFLAPAIVMYIILYIRPYSNIFFLYYFCLYYIFNNFSSLGELPDADTVAVYR